MRNILEYPVTAQEKHDVIQRLLTEWVASNPPYGDVTGMVLQDLLNDMIRNDPTIKHDYFPAH